MKRTFFKQVLVSIISAILIAIIFFVWHTFFNRPDNISGVWEAECTVLKSNHAEYVEMVVYFDVILRQTGTQVEGAGEKIAEKVKGQERYEFERDKRVHIAISGNLKNNFLRTDRVLLHCLEHGRKRDSSTMTKLEIVDDNMMVGEFFSTAADSTGKSIWRKKTVASN